MPSLVMLATAYISRQTRMSTSVHTGAKIWSLPSPPMSLPHSPVTPYYLPRKRWQEPASLKQRNTCKSDDLTTVQTFRWKWRCFSACSNQTKQRNAVNDFNNNIITCSKHFHICSLVTLTTTLEGISYSHIWWWWWWGESEAVRMACLRPFNESVAMVRFVYIQSIP